MLEPQESSSKAHFFLLRPLPKTKAKLAKIGIFAKVNAKIKAKLAKIMPKITYEGPKSPSKAQNNLLSLKIIY